MWKFKFRDREFSSKMKPEILVSSLDMVFIYSVIWSIGASTDEKGRGDVDWFIKQLMKNPVKCETKKDKLIKFEKQSLLPEAGP